jgi:hypothetical protein
MGSIRFDRQVARFTQSLADVKADDRSAVLAQARLSTPERFATTTDPKILVLPGQVWINRPVGVPVVAEGGPQLAA